MPTFSWIGRTRQGQSVSGDVDASSKDDAVRLLAARQIEVTTIAEHATRASEPPDPDRAIRRSSEPSKPTPWRGLFIAFLLVVAAFGVGAFYPLLIVDCERTQAGAVNCVIHESMWGVVPLRAQSLNNVSEITSEEQSSSSTDRNSRRTYTTSEYRIILHGAGGASIRPRYWSGEHVIGATNADIRSRVNELMDGSTPDRKRSWQLGYTPIIVSGALVLIALLGGTLSLLSFSSKFTERVQARLAKVSEAARQRQRR